MDFELNYFSLVYAPTVLQFEEGLNNNCQKAAGRRLNGQK